MEVLRPGVPDIRISPDLEISVVDPETEDRQKQPICQVPLTSATSLSA